jgi:hypothetical protein
MKDMLEKKYSKILTKLITFVHLRKTWNRARTGTIRRPDSQWHNTDPDTRPSPADPGMLTRDTAGPRAPCGYAFENLPHTCRSGGCSFPKETRETPADRQKKMMMKTSCRWKKKRQEDKSHTRIFFYSVVKTKEPTILQLVCSLSLIRSQCPSTLHNAHWSVV